ncbi:hypothetical protein V0R50_24410 [Pseudomonas sp. 148P]|uniref:ATPase n=1 Tax=Pseudomonas ulcerans TaxID=3115852 RepID=A0ABU7HXW2_9PSED|nr:MULTISPECIES: hypothetical protein [unclassified Pseudomonas]MEE1924765.1 hypothetical protein [Pseudomonas sp. 147P]MEE1936383.1 hypothetical protein [Pseudomonas sp. 148P]
MYRYTVDYLFNDKPQSHTFELKQARLPLHEAAMHLLILHFGDGENSLVMPAADATPAQVMEQAERVGLRGIEVVG